MKKNAKIFAAFLVVVFVLLIVYFYYQKGQVYTYEWVEVKDSSIGQYLLYINDARGRHVNGTARLVYINGKSKRVEIDKEGLLYMKSIVLEVRNPNKR